jgi:hypothetical protein
VKGCLVRIRCEVCLYVAVFPQIKFIAFCTRRDRKANKLAFTARQFFKCRFFPILFVDDIFILSELSHEYSIFILCARVTRFYLLFNLFPTAIKIFTIRGKHLANQFARRKTGFIFAYQMRRYANVL